MNSPPINTNHLSAQANLDYNLMEFIELSNAKGVKRIIEAGANVNCDISTLKLSPLIEAIKNKSFEITQLLTERGADVNDQRSIITNGPNSITSVTKNALMAAVEAGSLETVQLLVNKGANINDRDTAGYTPIMVAAHLNKPGILDYLLTIGASHQSINIASETLHDIVMKTKNQNIKAVYADFLLLQTASNETSAVVKPSSRSNQRKRI